MGFGKANVYYTNNTLISTPDNTSAIYVRTRTQEITHVYTNAWEPYTEHTLLQQIAKAITEIEAAQCTLSCKP